MKKSTTKKSAEKTINVVVYSLVNEEFGKVRVAEDKELVGYVCADDLYRILKLSDKELLSQPGLSDYVFTITVENAAGKQQELPFVNESGLYILYLLSKLKNAVRFQNWLDEKFFGPLYEQRKGSNDFVVRRGQQCESLRLMATAANVVKSEHFKTGKDIPDLTYAHLMGWWNNPNDKSTFMLQFNCQDGSLIFGNLRMNIYLTKPEDGCTDGCDMQIRFLDLDDDNYEYLSYNTIMPYYAVCDKTILDYLLEELTMDENLLEEENADLVIILNSLVSFHRSRRIEKKEDQPLIEFV